MAKKKEYKATGYSSDQFWRINTYEGARPSTARTSQDNPEFLYPGNLIPNIYDSPNNVKTDTKVQRGFIRGILPEVLNQAGDSGKKGNKAQVAPTRRCYFQFNPNLILRSVTASSSTLSPILQDPTQLIQPIPGQASFEFQLMFNREREVSNQKYLTPGLKGLKETRDLNSSLDNYQYSQQDVGSLGVLADLQVLDSIIGQSITNDMIDMVANYWEVTKKFRSSDTEEEEEEEDEDSTDEEEAEKDADKKEEKKKKKKTNPNDGEEFNFESAEFKEGLKSVVGNTAFLNPLPVRIVFSSLFMVEGFVTASNVAFHKFTKNMVPTVCTVTLNVQALYIGFARKKSYVSEQFAKAIEASQELERETERIAETAKKLADYYFYARLSHLTPANGATQSLNEWIKGEWDERGVDGNFFFVSGLSAGSGSRNTPSILHRPGGLHIWPGLQLQRTYNNTIREIKITDITLYFINRDKLPAELKDDNSLRKAVENGIEGSDYLVNSCSLYTAPYSSAATSMDNDGFIKFKYEDLAKSSTTPTSPLSAVWKSDKLPNILSDPGIAYFGNSTSIAALFSIQVTHPDANGNPQTIFLRKADINTIDPNSAADFFKFRTPNGNKATLRMFSIGGENAPRSGDTRGVRRR